jgi:hypothetical protein
LLSVDRRETDFLDPDAATGVADREFIDWTRQNGGGRHHVRLEHRLHEFGTVDLATEDLTLTVEERLDLTSRWRWELDGDVIDREASSTVSVRDVRDSRLRNRVRATLRDQDILDFNLAFGSTEFNTAETVDRQLASVFYRWRKGPAWEIAPFVRFDRQSQADRTLAAPRAGLGAFWTGAALGFETQVGARASLGTIRDQDDDGTDRDRRQAFGVTGSFARGAPDTLRQSLELEWSANEFRVERERIVGLPDLGLTGTTVGSEDFVRVRFNLDRAFDSRAVRGWGEWSRRSGTRDPFGTGVDSAGWRGGAHWSARGVAFQGDLGETTVDRQDVSTDQKIRYATALASWRPVPYLTFRAAYRLDRRELEAFEDIDGSNLETTMQLRLGLLTLNAGVYERSEEVATGGQRTTRTVRWGLTSRFGGWLPIVTGTKRRGVIR